MSQPGCCCLNVARRLAPSVFVAIQRRAIQFWLHTGLVLFEKRAEVGVRDALRLNIPQQAKKETGSDYICRTAIGGAHERMFFFDRIAGLMTSQRFDRRKGIEKSSCGWKWFVGPLWRANSTSYSS